jgi:hypothetical protein
MSSAFKVHIAEDKNYCLLRYFLRFLNDVILYTLIKM